MKEGLLSLSLSSPAASRRTAQDNLGTCRRPTSPCLPEMQAQGRQAERTPALEQHSKTTGSLRHQAELGRHPITGVLHRLSPDDTGPPSIVMGPLPEAPTASLTASRSVHATFSLERGRPGPTATDPSHCRVASGMSSPMCSFPPKEQAGCPASGETGLGGRRGQDT